VKRDGAAAVKRLRDLAQWYRGSPAEAEESAERRSRIKYAAILDRLADEEELRAAASKTGAR
jgi:hypothetical protein